jgi:octaprenyl-diphosphate synthase
MLQEVTPRSEPAPEVLERLRDLCLARGLDGLADNLGELMSLAGADLEAIERELGTGGPGKRLAERAASYLVRQGGKRLRPLCVALAARTGNGFERSALDLAIAVELIHNATLLHDDVIDLADTRRGVATARTEFGNAASIFAGDWLLIEALQRVRRAAVPGTLDALLETISEMIRAESLQLENRGRIDLDRDLYFDIVEGKSATLFRWAMAAGGRAGGLDDERCAALEAYGGHLGVAFQVIDDLLDLTGGNGRTGKAPFTDLREGKMTYPVLVALEREPGLRPTLEEIMSVGPLAVPKPQLLERVRDGVNRTGAMAECRELAAKRVSAASAALSDLPESEARSALRLVAESTVHRQV